jgi:hypothetical protein
MDKNGRPYGLPILWPERRLCTEAAQKKKKKKKPYTAALVSGSNGTNVCA